jgi:hypothetical protein
LKLFLSLFLFYFAARANAQSVDANLKFEKIKGDFFGLDTSHVNLKNRNSNSPNSSYIAVKSIATNTKSSLIVFVSNQVLRETSKLNFRPDNSIEDLSFAITKEQKYELFLPQATKDYDIEVFCNTKSMGFIAIRVMQPIVYLIKVIPIQNTRINSSKIQTELNSIFQFVNIQFKIQLVQPRIVQKGKNDKLNNPNASRTSYTSQMHEIRDAYFTKNPQKDNNPCYFLIDEFVNHELDGFSVRSKSLGFIKTGSAKTIARLISHEFTFGYASTNVRDTTRLLNFETNAIDNEEAWNQLRNIPAIGSFYDDYENVASSNGLIAYYFWKTNTDGSIKIENGNFLESIKRPYKKNTYSYHLEIRHFFYKVLFTVKKWDINSLHFLSLVVTSLFWFKFRKKLKQSKFYLAAKRSWIFTSTIRICFLFFTLSFLFFTFILIDKGYALYEIKAGKIQEFTGLKSYAVVQKISETVHPKRKSEKAIGSEFIIQKGRYYEVKHVEQVCYFKAILNEQQKIVELRFVAASQELKLKNNKQSIKSQSHYQVVDCFTQKGEFISQNVYNHLGQDITNKLMLKDIPKRILVFVNGYRPTSLSNSLDKNIADIGRKGLEYPETFNNLYAYDRYNYWHPWGEIDALFSNRLNPSEVYYADGHHSVETSNYRSLLNFSYNSTVYPKRCSNKRHHCTTTTLVKNNLFKSKTVQTYSLLPVQSNARGFATRKKNGIIAGRNLLQLLNELPNTSKNDTLFIIAHSMGFAYSLGMIEVMRGNINFGSFYIIAPENAKAGRVIPKEWQSVHQYGSNFNKGERDAPCLQDGVAPQTPVAGIQKNQRIYTPMVNYTKKGFFDSHFIGYFTWIFDIKPTEQGAIKQH